MEDSMINKQIKHLTERKDGDDLIFKELQLIQIITQDSRIVYLLRVIYKKLTYLHQTEEVKKKVT